MVELENSFLPFPDAENTNISDEMLMLAFLGWDDSVERYPNTQTLFDRSSSQAST